MNPRLFPFTCLEINSLTPENVERVCEYAKRFNVTTIGYMGAEWQRYQFLDHTEWGVPPIDDAAKRFMEDYQETIRRTSETVAGHGLDFYLWRRDLRIPMGFVEKYGVDWINFENPELWDLLRWNTEQIFKLFPQTKGIFLSCTGEQKAGEWITANGVGGNLPLWQRFVRMFTEVKTVCDKLGREAVFRNHGVGNDAIPLVYDESMYMWHFLKAAKEVGNGITLMAKGVEPDYQATYPFNALLAPMATQQRTYMELSLPMEYNAVGRTPFPMVEDIKMRLLCAKKINCQGAVARVDWHMSQHQTQVTWSCLDNFNEINVYAFCRLINEPGLPVAQIFDDFARERFGDKARKTTVAVYKDLYEAGYKNYYELGTKGCRTPSGAPNAPDGHLAALRRDHLIRWSYSPVDFANQYRALNPDEHFINRLIEEKNQGLAIYKNSLGLLRQNRAEFAEKDAAQFEASLERACAEVEIRREYMGAFHAWLAFENGGEPHYAELADKYIATLEPLIPPYHEKYDGLEEWDADAKDAFEFGANMVDSLTQLKKKLADSREYWKGALGAPLPVPYSGERDGAVEIPVGDGSLTFDPLAAAMAKLTVPGSENLLGELVPAVIYRVGGLEEKLRDLGRAFVGVRHMRLPHGGSATIFYLAHYGTRLRIETRPGINGFFVKCTIGRMPCAGKAVLPWAKALPSTTGDELALPGLREAFGVAADAPALTVGEGNGRFAMIFPTSQTLQPALTKEGGEWAISEPVAIECLVGW